MSKQIKASLFCIFILCLSCKSILTKIVTNRSIVKNAHYLQKDDQKVIYLPMSHLSKYENFEEVKGFINEKRNLGYQVYYEKVTYDINSVDYKESSLKMRKLTGLTFGQKYLSEEQQKFRENVNDKKYTWQSKVDYGLNYQTDIHADYNITDLIKAYEDKWGKVILEPCDYNTPLNVQYTCSSPTKYQEVVHDLRNTKLLKHILDTVPKKKLIVYGLGHYYSSSGVYINLYHRKEYEEVKAKNWKD